MYGSLLLVYTLAWLNFLLTPKILEKEKKSCSLFSYLYVNHVCIRLWSCKGRMYFEQFYLQWTFDIEETKVFTMKSTPWIQPHTFQTHTVEAMDLQISTMFVILLLSCRSTFGIQLVGNGYTGVFFAINPAVRENPALLKSIEVMLTLWQYTIMVTIQIHERFEAFHLYGIFG